jgi:hypothetical protein
VAADVDDLVCGKAVNPVICVVVAADRAGKGNGLKRMIFSTSVQSVLSGERKMLLAASAKWPVQLGRSQVYAGIRALRPYQRNHNNRYVCRAIFRRITGWSLNCSVIGRTWLF